MEFIKYIYNIKQLDDILREKENNLYILGKFVIYNGKIAINKCFNQAYNFANHSVRKTLITKELKDKGELRLTKMVKKEWLDISNLGTT